MYYNIVFVISIAVEHASQIHARYRVERTVFMVKEFARDSIWKDPASAIDVPVVPSNVQIQQAEGCSKEGMTKENQDVAMTKEEKYDSSFSASTMSSTYHPKEGKKSSSNLSTWMVMRDIHAQ